MKDQLAAGGGGIDRFGEAAEACPAFLKCGDGLYQVRQVTAKAIQFPDDQHVAFPHILKRLLQPWPIGARTGSTIFKHLGAPRGGECIELQRWVLIEGADPGVSDMCQGRVRSPVRQSYCPTSHRRSRVSGHFRGDRSRIVCRTAAGDLGAFFGSLADEARPGTDPDWLPRLQSAVRAALAADAPLLASDAEPVHPVRVYGELLKELDDDAVVIGDGGDFVSFAGRLVEPGKPGRWLDPGPFGCLGTGLGYAAAARLAHPSAQVVLLLGDGAAGLSLMDADTLVRHNLPVVIICGNNGAWGLEKQPMRAVYGYDVAADLRPGTRYDDVVRALGGAGELVTSPAQIGPALRRAFASGGPYLVNVITDVDATYPRTTTGV